MNSIFFATLLNKTIYFFKTPPPLCNSDHNVIHLLPTYRSVFKTCKPKMQTVKVWTRGKKRRAERLLSLYGLGKSSLKTQAFIVQWNQSQITFLSVSTLLSPRKLLSDIQIINRILLKVSGNVSGGRELTLYLATWQVFVMLNRTSISKWERQRAEQDLST